MSLYSITTPYVTYVLYTTGEDPRIETSCSTECIPAVICSNNSSYQRYHAAMNLYPIFTCGIRYCIIITISISGIAACTI